MLIKKKNRQPAPSPEYMAEWLLTELKINELEDLFYLEELAIRRNALVIYEKLEGSEARLAVHGRRAIITVSTSITSPYRTRFGIAHELGHLEMHRYESAFSICQSQDLNRWRANKQARNLEAEANQFAAAFLLPERFFKPLCLDSDPYMKIISGLAGDFQTSLAATALRYIHFSSEPCAVVYSQNQRVEWVVPNQAFRELGVYVERNVRLDAAALAHKALQGKTNRQEGQVRLATWAAPGKYTSDTLVREESWYSSMYDSVLTLLWADDEIFEGEDSFEL